MSAPTRCWVAVLVSASTIAECTGLFFILLATLNCGTSEANFPAHSISTTPSFMPTAASAIGSESLASVSTILRRLTVAASIPFYSMILIPATQRPVNLRLTATTGAAAKGGSGQASGSTGC